MKSKTTKAEAKQKFVCFHCKGMATSQRDRCPTALLAASCKITVILYTKSSCIPEIIQIPVDTKPLRRFDSVLTE